MDTKEKVASFQVWDTGDIYLECLIVENEEPVMREHHENLSLDAIKAALRRFVEVVGGAE